MEYQMKRVDISDFKDYIVSEVNGIEKPILKNENRYIVLSDFQTNIQFISETIDSICYTF